MERMRLITLSLCFAAGLAAVLTEHFLLSVPRREHYLRTGRKMALLRKEFFPPRARLLAEDGTPLAWSERTFELVWNEPVAPDSLLLRKIAGQIGVRQPLPEIAQNGRSWVIIPDLTPDQILKAAPLSSLHPALTVRSHLERISVQLPAVQRKIGATVLRRGVLVGISGWEKEFDTLLRGTPGRFEVMLDRRRRWISSSWKLLAPAVPGKDVTVHCDLEQTAP